MRVFERYRYVKPSPDPDIEFMDGYRNIVHATRWPDWPGVATAGRVQRDHAMDSVKMVKTTDGSTPALSASKRHRADSDWTPWHDELDAERGSRRPAAILGD